MRGTDMFERVLKFLMNHAEVVRFIAKAEETKSTSETCMCVVTVTRRRTVVVLGYLKHYVNACVRVLLNSYPWQTGQLFVLEHTYGKGGERKAIVGVDGNLQILT